MTFDQAIGIVLDSIQDVAGTDPASMGREKSLKAAGVKTATALDALNDTLCTSHEVGVPSVGETLEANALDVGLDTTVNALIVQVHDKSVKMHPALLKAFAMALSASPSPEIVRRLKTNVAPLRRHKIAERVRTRKD